MHLLSLIRQKHYGIHSIPLICFGLIGRCRQCVPFLCQQRAATTELSHNESILSARRVTSALLASDLPGAPRCTMIMTTWKIWWWIMTSRHCSIDIPFDISILTHFESSEESMAVTLILRILSIACQVYYLFRYTNVKNVQRKLLPLNRCHHRLSIDHRHYIRSSKQHCYWSPSSSSSSMMPAATSAAFQEYREQGKSSRIRKPGICSSRVKC